MLAISITAHNTYYTHTAYNIYIVPDTEKKEERKRTFNGRVTVYEYVSNDCKKEPVLYCVLLGCNSVGMTKWFIFTESISFFGSVRLNVSEGVCFCV